MGKGGDDSSNEEKQSSNVYIMDPEFGWRPATLEGEQGDFAIVNVPEYKDEMNMVCDGGRTAKSFEKFKVNLKDYPHKVLPLQNVDANGTLTEYPDMVRLPYLHEPAILYNMKKRHMNGKPYTRTGDIIIAINPFQWFHDLYTEKKRTYYSNRLVWEATGEDDPRDKIEPHVYEVSALAYKGLAFEHGDQSILVSGESGAGKTETVKICMNHIASVQRGPATLTSGDDLDPVVQRVVESNPLLEAFGNAKTQRNDNSSRFGKYLQLQFDRSSAKNSDITDRSKSTCVLAGSKCDVYLLEKNRVTGHSDKERTYHIFYQLLAAPESDKASYWPKLKGRTNKDFKYIGPTDTTKIEGMTDAQHYDHTVKTLALINITGERLATLMRAIAIVMQCGNLTFGAKGGDKDKSDITSKTDLADLAGLMGVSEPDLTCAFTERTMKTKTEEYKVPLNQDAAKDACDAFAKEVYGKVFLWLVKQINDATCAEDNYKGPATEYGIVGLLDIFGFESFVVNRFEQLCINYANEKLQQKFTEDVFRAVQLEYEAEGIELAEITYDDNTDVLDLIEGRTGLLALLNEECVRPKGNDQQFVQKALQQNASSPCLIVNKMDRMSFGIHHYAGKVMYDADQFVTRNQDTLPTDLEDIGMKSSNEIVSRKTEEAPKEVPSNKRTLVRQKSNIVAPTVWGKYKTQLQELMTNLRKTNSRYIRCIKPNMKKVPVLMEHIPTVEQLRCAGVVAAVTLARSAFPNRLDNASVRFRYGSMWEKSQYPSAKTSSMDVNEALRCDCDAILNCALKPKETVNDDGKVAKAFVVGRTKSYFRAGALEYLESNRKTGLDGQATTIQRFARGWLIRKQVGDYAKRKAAEEIAAREEKARAEREAKEKYEREKAERQAKRESDRKKYNDKIEALKKELKDADHYRKTKLSSIKEDKEALERDIEELREQTNEDARKAANEPKKIMAQQKKKLDEQTKMIDFLKKENKKIRKDHDKIKGKFDVVKGNNDKLLKANEEAGNNFEATDSSSMRVHEKNEKLTTTLDNAKNDNKRMKNECMAAQDKYMSQAETRLEYQKTMARILNMIQDKLRDPQLVEDTVCLALDCESEAKSVMAALEAETDDY